tara:strand:- start:234 stop:1019 length:786 start_codon:yes stop_codon:yes gene_type:complete
VLRNEETLKRKTVIVTGSARGIGLTTARLFISSGWNAVLVDRDSDQLSKIVTEDKNSLPLALDISKPEQIDRIIKDTLGRFGRIDALINNAGVADFGPIENTNFNRWREVMETNLDGMFLCVQAAAKELKKTKGSIVNIGSISGLRASTLRVAYGTSKAAVIHLTKQQAVELGEHEIRVNCVAPGPVRTKLAAAVHTQEIVDAYHDAIPLNRYGTEEEIGQVIYFLCSDKASYLTGQIIAVDGGFEAAGVGLSALRESLCE